MTHTIDYSALTSPTNREAVRAFRTQMKAAGHNWGRFNPQGLIVGVAVFIGVFVVGGTALNGFALALVADVGNELSPTRFVLPLIITAVVVALVLFAVRNHNVSWERWMRLSRFAADNDLVYSPSDPGPSYPGLIFGQGHSAKALNHLRSKNDRFLDIGSYQYETGSGKNRRTHDWGFMALHLDRKLPHMLLDAKSNNFIGTNLPTSFKKEQALSLEGDFDRYFTLYCPKAYERDALYVFTPDLMALLIDEAAPFDVEIVDDWMFVYSSRPFNPTDPAVYQRLFRIVDTVGAKTLSQTDRYVDDRVGSFAANIVAPQGRRLQKGFPVVAVVLVAIFAAVWVLPQLLELFS